MTHQEELISDSMALVVAENGAVTSVEGRQMTILNVHVSSWSTDSVSHEVAEKMAWSGVGFLFVFSAERGG